MSKVPVSIVVPLAAAVVLMARMPVRADKVFEVKLANPAFTEGVDQSGIPLGWSSYGGSGKNQELKVVDIPGGGKALLIADGDPTARSAWSRPSI